MADSNGVYRDATRAGSYSDDVCARESALGSIKSKLARLGEAIDCSEKCVDEVYDSLLGPRPPGGEKAPSTITSGALDHINKCLEELITRVQRSTSMLNKVMDELRG